jgi:hypothetical protein
MSTFQSHQHRSLTAVHLSTTWALCRRPQRLYLWAVHSNLLHVLAAAAVAFTGFIWRSGVPILDPNLLWPGLLAHAQPRRLQHCVLQLRAGTLVLACVPHLSGCCCGGLTGVLRQH